MNFNYVSILLNRNRERNFLFYFFIIRINKWKCCFSFFFLPQPTAEKQKAKKKHSEFNIELRCNEFQWKILRGDQVFTFCFLHLLENTPKWDRPTNHAKGRCLANPRLFFSVPSAKNYLQWFPPYSYNKSKK